VKAITFLNSTVALFFVVGLQIFFLLEGPIARTEVPQEERR